MSNKEIVMQKGRPLPVWYVPNTLENNQIFKFKFSKDAFGNTYYEYDSGDLVVIHPRRDDIFFTFRDAQKELVRRLKQDLLRMESTFLKQSAEMKYRIKMARSLSST